MWYKIYDFPSSFATTKFQAEKKRQYFWKKNSKIYFAYNFLIEEEQMYVIASFILYLQCFSILCTKAWNKILIIIVTRSSRLHLQCYENTGNTAFLFNKATTLYFYLIPSLNGPDSCKSFITRLTCKTRKKMKKERKKERNKGKKTYKQES